MNLVQINKNSLILSSESLTSWRKCFNLPTATQLCVLQFRDCVAGPGHGAPPPDGGGLVHCRCRCCVPPLQGALHEPHKLQALQPPLTLEQNYHTLELKKSKGNRYKLQKPMFNTRVWPSSRVVLHIVNTERNSTRLNVAEHFLEMEMKDFSVSTYKLI